MINKSIPVGCERWLVIGFFGLILCLGMLLVRDYGVSYDEDTSKENGRISLFYVFQKLPTQLQRRVLSPHVAELIATKGHDRQLKDYKDRDYGVAFELPVTVIEQVLHLHDEREVFLMRHICTFLVCFAGLVAFYFLAARRFASWRIGLLGALLLVLSPRMFSDYFYNDKDAIFLALFTVALATAVPFIRRPTWKSAFWHALACALAIDVRIMGVLMPAATLAFVGLRLIRGEYQMRAALVSAAVYLVLLAGFIVAMWPYLWEAPVANFAEAFLNMSHFRWPFSVLYQGQMVLATKIPWHYALVWIGITTPLLYLLFFAVGAVLVLGKLVTRRLKLYASDEEWQDLLFLSLGLVPLVAVIYLHSVLYNGWRQLYFCYPLLLLVSLRGMVAAWHWQPQWQGIRRYWQAAVSVLVAASLLFVAGRMVRLHPFEHVYFNALAQSPVESNYEVDYWGLSFHKGLQWIVEHDARPHIRIYTEVGLEPPFRQNRFMLFPAERSRVERVEKPEEADYTMTLYLREVPAHSGKIVHTIQIENTSLLSIYKF